MRHKTTKKKTAQQLEDEEFLRTGSFTISFNVDLEVTEDDMLRDLVNKTEGLMIEPELPAKHNNN